jgi:hypothetical protein
MSRKHYFVAYGDGEWKIILRDQKIGGFPSETAAFRAAVDAAHLVGTKGGNAEVLVQTDDNTFRVRWTYGKDPYPPLI